MICFHFTIFVVLETTLRNFNWFDVLLWFAFILLSLSYWKQLVRSANRIRPVVICFHFTIFVVLETTTLLQAFPHIGCDLLSFYYLCRTGNNSWVRPTDRKTLWFAFILLSLSYWKQQGAFATNTLAGCDLLSFYYLCRTGNNERSGDATRRAVVICFHFTIFVVLETTGQADGRARKGLWFAFILLSLSYWKQRQSRWNRRVRVVICFHFTIFVVLETTTRNLHALDRLLWFAFILLSLSYWKQRRAERSAAAPSCDLLSFYYLCRTGNNTSGHGYGRTVLWFAFILLSLSYWKQQRQVKSAQQ